MATGLDHVWDRVNHCWRPVIDKTGRSSNPAIYIAGDGGGIAGGAAAELSGLVRLMRLSAASNRLGLAPDGAA